MSYIEFSKVCKEYMITKELKIKAVNDVSINMEEGEFVVILGASGAGKTTVLNLIGGMDSVSRGTIIVDDKNISNLSINELAEYRRNDVGFVFQFYNLISDLTALENVELVTEVSSDALNAKSVINDVGLSKRMYNYPSQLSGGEQQRIAIARAIAKNPKILLCDEPTGALDSENGKNILYLLKEIVMKKNKTVIMVTHNAEFTKIADRVITMKDGAVESNILQRDVLKVDDILW